MKKISSYIAGSFSSVEGIENDEIKKALRIGKVRNIWSELVEDYILEHTNGVYILKDDNKTVMKVYVDESIYASELNNRRELIQLLCRERFGEVIDEFQIYISYGLMKKNYPFKKEVKYEADKRPPISLTNTELQEVETLCEGIANSSLKEQFKKAMIADLEWKKGNP